jgi:hypothetical protein
MENTNGKLIREMSTFFKKTHKKLTFFSGTILLTKCKYQTQMENTNGKLKWKTH